MHRGLFTDALLDWIRTCGVPCGDGLPPKEGGWVSGTPNVGTHVPFVTILTGAATETSRTVSMTRSKDWSLVYQLKSSAVSRSACDEVAFRARAATESLTPFEFDGFKAVHVSITGIGAVFPSTSTEPRLWECTDSLEVTCVPL